MVFSLHSSEAARPDGLTAVDLRVSPKMIHHQELRTENSELILFPLNNATAQQINNSSTSAEQLRQHLPRSPLDNPVISCGSGRFGVDFDTVSAGLLCKVGETCCGPDGS